MYCTRCGYQAREDANYCSRCGLLLHGPMTSAGAVRSLDDPWFDVPIFRTSSQTRIEAAKNAPATAKSPIPESPAHTLRSPTMDLETGVATTDDRTPCLSAPAMLAKEAMGDGMMGTAVVPATGTTSGAAAGAKPARLPNAAVTSTEPSMLADAVRRVAGAVMHLVALLYTHGRRLHVPRVAPAIPKNAGLAVAVLLLVGVAELLVAYGDPRYGVAMHIALLTLTLGLAAQETDEARQGFFLVVAIAPLIRIVSTGMPLHAFPELFWYLLTSIPLFLAAYSIAREAHVSPRSLKLRLPERRYLPLEAAVAVSGLGLGYIEWSILRSGPIVDGRSRAWMLAGGLILLICTGLIEELLFRGLIQHAAERFFGSKGGIAFTAALFAMLHIGHLSIMDDLFVAGVGVYFGLVARRTQSLLGVTLAHGMINIMLFIVLPLSLLPRPV